MSSRELNVHSITLAFEPARIVEIRKAAGIVQWGPFYETKRRPIRLGKETVNTGS